MRYGDTPSGVAALMRAKKLHNKIFGKGYSMRSGGETYRKRTESTLTNACLDYLKMLENQKLIAWVDRLNSGEIIVPAHRNGKGNLINARRIRLCREGTPDIYFITNKGLFIYPETKMPGNEQSTAQKAFQAMIEAVGHRYWLIYDINVLIIKAKEAIQNLI